MDFVTAMVAWLDWQSDRHLDVTAMAAVVLVDNDVTLCEVKWWSAHPARTRALVTACLESGWVRYPGWWGYDYDVRDLRNATNADYERTEFEVRWTLNRLRDRRWGLIP